MSRTKQTARAIPVEEWIIKRKARINDKIEEIVRLDNKMKISKTKEDEEKYKELVINYNELDDELKEVEKRRQEIKKDIISKNDDKVVGEEEEEQEPNEEEEQQEEEQEEEQEHQEPNEEEEEQEQEQEQEQYKGQKRANKLKDKIEKRRKRIKKLSTRVDALYEAMTKDPFNDNIATKHSRLQERVNRLQLKQSEKESEYADLINPMSDEEPEVEDKSSPSKFILLLYLFIFQNLK